MVNATHRLGLIALLLVATAACKPTTPPASPAVAPTPAAPATDASSPADTAAAQCATRDFDAFLAKFSSDVAAQRAGTVDPLGESSLDAAGNTSTKYVPLAKVDFPLIYSAAEQKTQDLVQKVSAPAPDQRIVVVSRPDTDIQTTYTFMADPCWKLVGLSDDTPADTDGNRSANGAKTAMEKTCLGATMRLTADPAGDNNEDSPRTSTLQLVSASSAVRHIDRPKEMKAYTAVGLACAVAKNDNKAYFVVQYGELPTGCENCEWYYLYDASGKQLTHSDPPMSEDKSLPPAQQQVPNNREYDALLGKLGISHPELDYLD